MPPPPERHTFHGSRPSATTPLINDAQGNGRGDSFTTDGSESGGGGATFDIDGGYQTAGSFRTQGEGQLGVDASLGRPRSRSMSDMHSHGHGHPFDEDIDHADGRHHTKDAGFGGKTIGFFGGFSLLVNNMSGPGMMEIPSIFQEAGWLPPMICLIVVCIVATLSSTMLCEAMSAIPGNEHFEDRVELTTLAKFYFGRVGFYITLTLFVLSLQAVNIASIVVSAQTMDLTIVRIFKKTCALEWAPDPSFICHEGHGTSDSPFGDSTYVVSIGFVVVLIMAVPLGYVNLDDNIIVQKIACLLFLVIMLEWIVWFLYRGPLDFTNVPVVGDNLSTVLGTVIFNYAYVTTIPSWVNEKKPHVSVNKSMWGAAVLSTSLFSVVGIVGAWAYHFTPTEDILSKINDDKVPASWLFTASQITVYAFPLVALLTGIPIFSIIVRYNLVENNIMRKSFANVFAVLLPWLVAIPAYTGTGLMLVINWTSLLINGAINFIIPVTLYILSRRDTYNRSKSHLVVRTFGAHGTNVMSGEVPATIDLTSQTQRAAIEATRFSALPRGFGRRLPMIVGWGIVVFFTIATIAAIIIAVVQAVENASP
jgi:Transmembrane amino acid transporter protein